MPSSIICPPSRIGIGSKFKIPRFTLISTISEIMASDPSWPLVRPRARFPPALAVASAIHVR